MLHIQLESIFCIFKDLLMMLSMAETMAIQSQLCENQADKYVQQFTPPTMESFCEYNDAYFSAKPQTIQDDSVFNDNHSIFLPKYIHL